MEAIKGVNPTWEKLIAMKNKLYSKAFILRVKMNPQETAKPKPGEFLPLEQIFGNPKAIRSAKTILKQNRIKKRKEPKSK